MPTISIIDVEQRRIAACAAFRGIELLGHAAGRSASHRPEERVQNPCGGYFRNCPRNRIRTPSANARAEESGPIAHRSDQPGEDRIEETPRRSHSPRRSVPKPRRAYPGTISDPEQWSSNKRSHCPDPPARTASKTRAGCGPVPVRPSPRRTALPPRVMKVRGPSRSISQPESGIVQVITAMKTVKPHCTSDSFQWWPTSSAGRTASRHTAGCRS